MLDSTVRIIYAVLFILSRETRENIIIAKSFFFFVGKISKIGKPQTTPHKIKRKVPKTQILGEEIFFMHSKNKNKLLSVTVFQHR